LSAHRRRQERRRDAAGGKDLAGLRVQGVEVGVEVIVLALGEVQVERRRRQIADLQGVVPRLMWLDLGGA